MKRLRPEDRRRIVVLQKTKTFALYTAFITGIIAAVMLIGYAVTSNVFSDTIRRETIASSSVVSGQVKKDEDDMFGMEAELETSSSNDVPISDTYFTTGDLQTANLVYAQIPTTNMSGSSNLLNNYPVNMPNNNSSGTVSNLATSNDKNDSETDEQGKESVDEEPVEEIQQDEKNNDNDDNTDTETENDDMDGDTDSEMGQDTDKIENDDDNLDDLEWKDVIKAEPMTIQEQYSYIDTDAVMYSTASLNIRSGPSTDYDIISGYAKGAEVHVIGKSDKVNWYMVDYGNGNEGFVSAKYVSETKPTTTSSSSTPSSSGAVKESGKTSGGKLTKSKGVVYYNGHKETWYSQKVLPGGGLNIPGRHVNSEGLVCDGDGYICVASSDYKKGTIVETSLGMGKVYDTGCASGIIDIYTNW